MLIDWTKIIGLEIFEEHENISGFSFHSLMIFWKDCTYS